MPTGDAYSSGHLVPSLWDLHMFYLLRPILFRTCRYFTGLCSSNIPRYFLEFAFSRSSSIHSSKNRCCMKASRLPLQLRRRPPFRMNVILEFIFSCIGLFELRGPRSKLNLHNEQGLSTLGFEPKPSVRTKEWHLSNKYRGSVFYVEKRPCQYCRGSAFVYTQVRPSANEATTLLTKQDMNSYK